MQGCLKNVRDLVIVIGIGWLVWWLFDTGLLTWEQVTGVTQQFRQLLQANHPGVDFRKDINDFLYSPAGAILWLLALGGGAMVWGAVFGLGHYTAEETYEYKGKTYREHTPETLQALTNQANDGVMLSGMSIYLWPLLLAWTYSLAHAYWLMTDIGWQANSSLFMFDCIFGAATTAGILDRKIPKLLRVAGAAVGIFNFLLALSIYGGVVLGVAP